MERHRTDLVSLVIGLAVTAAGIAVVVEPPIQAPGAVLFRAADAWPVVLVIAGVWLVVRTLVRRDEE